jgi:hypothetical protein
MKTRKSKTNSLVKMSAAFKAKVLKALRSGKFIQGKSELYNERDNSYCCLGLMGKLCGVPELDMEGKGFPEDIFNKQSKKKLNPFLSQGSENDDIGDTIITKLANMNDSGKSFKQIAAYIERYL